MIRIVILLATIIIVSVCIAMPPNFLMMMADGTPVGGPTCADCDSNDASFLWECNSTTVGDTGYDPCGCSDGSTTMTVTDEATISSGLVVLDDTGSDGDDNYYSGSTSSQDMISGSVGTIFLKFQVITRGGDTVYLFVWYPDGDNFMHIHTTGTDDLEVLFKGQTNSQTVTLTGNQVATSTWLIARYRWDTTLGSNEHQLTLFDATMGQLDNTGPEDNLTALNGDAIMYVGHTDVTPTDYDIDIEYVHVYQAWKGDDPNAEAKTLDDSYAFSNDDAYNQVYSTYSRTYQCFESDGGTLHSAIMDMREIGTITGNAYFKVYAHTGTYGTTSEPTGSALATSDALDVTTLTSSYVETELEFSGADRITLTDSTYYCLSIEYTGGDGSNYLEITADSTSPTHGGNQGYYDTGWNVQAIYDTPFEVYVYR